MATKYASLVETAKQNNKVRVLREALETYNTNLGVDKKISLTALARELDYVNKHITVNPKEFEDAANDYNEIAEQLVRRLRWPNDAIQILPQGSCSTQTLIRSPGPERFDIDAVCQVDISRIEALDPMRFFDKVGDGLENWDPTPKKRCWRVEFGNRKYYIEFTPSVPLATIPATVAGSVRYKPAEKYRQTALAVVDTPTQELENVNPEGLTNWVSDQAKRSILSSALLEKRIAMASDSVTPVPEQEVPLSDTLRVAIRLLKRHRDMSVRRGEFDVEYKPISVIIVTLLTQCYEGLADMGSGYTHPIDLLIDLAELMPGMIEIRDGKYWVANPTVEGENFAEKWNDEPIRKKTFDNWCGILIDDLKGILSEVDEQAQRKKIREVFGCLGSVHTTPPSGSGLAPQAPNRVHTPPPTKGLA